MSSELIFDYKFDEYTYPYKISWKPYTISWKPKKGKHKTKILKKELTGCKKKFIHGPGRRVKERILNKRVNENDEGQERKGNGRNHGVLF